MHVPPWGHHDDVIKWKHFRHYWPFVRGIHRSPVNSAHKGQWRGALMFSLIRDSTNGWANNRDAAPHPPKKQQQQQQKNPQQTNKQTKPQKSIPRKSASSIRRVKQSSKTDGSGPNQSLPKHNKIRTIYIIIGVSIISLSTNAMSWVVTYSCSQ